MFCSSCGSELLDEAEFCDQCGAAILLSVQTPASQAPVAPAPAPIVQPATPPSSGTPTSRGLLIGLGIGAVVLLIAVVVVLVLANTDDGSDGDLARAQDKAAQSSLRNALAPGKTIFTDTDDYSGIAPASMTAVEPSLDYVGGDTPSTSPDQVSVYSDGDKVFAAASLSDTGTCWWVKDDAESGTTYGTGSADSCTGSDAAGASEATW